MMLTNPIDQITVRKTAQIYSGIQTGGGVGMQTLEAALANLYRQRLITEEYAMMKSQRPD